MRASATSNFLRWKMVLGLALCGCILFGANAFAANGGDTGRIHWKQIPDAQLKLDSKVPLNWNVFLPDKKKLGNLVLVLIGRRYIALDIKSKIAYAVELADLKAQGKDFESDSPVKSDHVIPTTEWSERDAGPAEIVKLTLGDYGRVLEIQLPHMPDIRLGLH
jgi:hypothetical protein